MSFVVVAAPSDHFNFLPDIMESSDVFRNRCTPEVFAQICQIFLKHHVQHVCGLALLHQHFDLQQDEKLVNIDNVAIPIKDSVSNLSIAASRWALLGEQVIPYEITERVDEIGMDIHAAFLCELSNKLRSYGLVETLGLCSVESISGTTAEPTMEFTSGRANITLAVDIDPLDGSSVEAAWRIDDGKWFPPPRTFSANG